LQKTPKRFVLEKVHDRDTSKYCAFPLSILFHILLKI
jgi:hypothetical protein